MLDKNILKKIVAGVKLFYEKQKQKNNNIFINATNDHNVNHTDDVYMGH